jgi:hypothetical protein
MPTTVWVARGKNGSRDKGYLYPHPFVPDPTNLYLS